MGSYISSAVNYYTPGQQSATPESHPAVTSQMSNPNKIDDKVDIDASMQPPTAKRPCLDTDNKTNNDAVGITMPVSSVHQNDNTTPEPPDRRGRWSFEGWIETWITYSSYGWFVSDTINFYDCTLKRTVVPGLLESGHDCSTIVVNLQRGYAQFIHADSQKVGHLRRTTVPFTLTIDAPLAIKKGTIYIFLDKYIFTCIHIQLIHVHVNIYIYTDDAGVVSKEQSALASESSSAFSAVHEAAAFARANGHVWIADIAQWASNEMDATSSKRIVFHDCQLTCTWVPSILEEYMCVDRIAICSPEQCLPSLSYIEVECFKKDLLSRIQIRWFWFPEQYSSHVDEFVPPGT